jgi:hypothetical protein
MNNSNIDSHKLVRAAALPALLISTVWSLCLMFIAGHNNRSFVLMSLFTLWVVSPYAALFIINRKSLITVRKRNYLTITISVCSVIFYTVGYLYPGKTPAFIFLLIPFMTWLFIGSIIIISKKNNKIKRKR